MQRSNELPSLTGAGLRRYQNRPSIGHRYLAKTAERVQRIFDQTPWRAIGKAFFEYFDEIAAASKYFDNRVFGKPPPDGDWSPIFSPNQINRPDNYYDLSIMRADDLEEQPNNSERTFNCPAFASPIL